MKINSQRSLLWLGNFAVVAGVFFLLYHMWQNSPRKINTRQRQWYKSVQKDLRNAKIPDVKRAASDNGPVLGYVLDNRKWHWAGYVEPPKPKPDEPVVTGPEKAPDLSTLLEVMLVAAPENEGGNPFGGALVKVGSKGPFFYKPGEKIGLGAYTTEKGDDTDPKLTKFKGAQLIRVRQSGIVCLWAEKEVEVALSRADVAGGIQMVGPNGQMFGSLEGGETTAAAVDLSKVRIGTTRKTGRGEILTISPDGLEAFQTGGGGIFEQISFEKAATPTNRNAVKVKNLPAELKNYGVNQGDVIVKIDGKAVSSKESIASHVRSTYKNKRQYQVTVMRGGAERTLTVNVPRTLSGQRDAARRFGRGRERTGRRRR